MMPRLHIDFGRRRLQGAPAGMVLLCVASLLLLVSGERLWHAYDESDRVQAQQDAQRHRLFAESHSAKTPPTPATRLAENQSLAVLRELTVPWQDLLSIVEDYPDHDVALIGIDQSPAQSQIRITAEAKNFDAMIAYLRYLQGSVLLREAVLNDHVIETNVPGTPVRFQITAVWRKS
ncbi:PilN domain-containing protein [Burkholderia sp. JPY481]|uniref:PilN domain-containing protein n=1 Tax=Paraburkholderia sp. JPY465 TaxID=3042285 RepID=UPI00317133F4